jgi:hypothetical protein
LILTVIGAIILILALILMSFLLIPFQISLELHKIGTNFKGNFALRWIGIKIFQREIPGEEKEEEKEKEKEEEKEEEKKKFDLQKILRIFNLFFESWPHLLNILKAFIKSLSLEKLSVHMTLGFESPADTAMITGYLWSFTYPISALTSIEASVTPDFNNRVLDGDLEMIVKLKLLWIAVEGIRAITKKPVRKLLQEMRSF